MAKEKITPREVNGSPSTERVAYRYNELLTKEAYIDSERAELYTEYIKKHWNEPTYLRAGGAMKAVLSGMTPKIWDGELIVGSQSRYFLGTQVYPEYETWMLEGFKSIKREEERYMEAPSRRRTASAWASTASIPRTAKRFWTWPTSGRAWTGVPRLKNA